MVGIIEEMGGEEDIGDLYKDCCGRLVQDEAGNLIDVWGEVWTPIQLLKHYFYSVFMWAFSQLIDFCEADKSFSFSVPSIVTRIYKSTVVEDCNVKGKPGKVK